MLNLAEVFCTLVQDETRVNVASQACCILPLKETLRLSETQGTSTCLGLRNGGHLAWDSKKEFQEGSRTVIKKRSDTSEPQDVGDLVRIFYQSGDTFGYNRLG